MEHKNTWLLYDEKQTKEAFDFAEGYKDFLNRGKTERECIDEIVYQIEKAGFVELETAISAKKTLKAGDKVYHVHMNKSIVMFTIGEKPMEEGMNVLGAHIDSPRLDVKQNPLYEESSLAYLDTHYYGGVKKYQWVTMPLAIHGVVVKKDGTTIELNVGEDEDDPVFFITDLLIHLSAEQMDKKAAKVIEGEALDIIVGSRPIVIDTEKEDNRENAGKAARDAVAKGVLAILKEQYGMEEEDFISAELEIVPAGKARDAGFDRSMVLAYGQDDKVCAYPVLKSFLEVCEPVRTTCCLLVDKEEIGSVGATGMKSKFFENALVETMMLAEQYTDLTYRRCLSNSCMLSADVNSAYDPTYASAFDKRNVAYLGGGMVFHKYGGSRGKSGSNDANAEYIAYLRRILDAEKVNFQTGELGKVDAGGGGTIAYILALYGMDVIDCGVPLLSMHGPWEAISKADLYEAMRGNIAFLKGERDF